MAVNDGNIFESYEVVIYTYLNYLLLVIDLNSVYFKIKNKRFINRGEYYGL
jgi:hypothetical protein